MPFIVEITKILPGSAPEGLKQALVGVEFKADYPSTIFRYNYAYLGSGLTRGRLDCCISAQDAHDALIKAGKPRTAAWFKKIRLLPGTITIALSPEENRFVKFI